MATKQRRRVKVRAPRAASTNSHALLGKRGQEQTAFDNVLPVHYSTVAARARATYTRRNVDEPA
jgi:hypothetical protein